MKVGVASSDDVVTSKVIQRVACKAVIEHGGKILILREASTYADGTHHGEYHLPGGRIEVGEPMFDGLQREVREETSLQIKIGRILYAGEWFPVIRTHRHHIVAMFFMCTSTSKAVRLSSEHDAFQWINPKDHERYRLVTPESKVIEAYLQSQG